MGMDFTSVRSPIPNYKTYVGLMRNNRSSSRQNSEEANVLSENEDLTPEEKKKLEEQQRRQKAAEQRQEMQDRLDELREQLESSNEETDAMEEEFRSFSKCMIIASRITRGDIVPEQDMKYLMEKQPELYKQAILMRQPKADPKRFDSILDEYDEEQNDEDILLKHGQGAPIKSVSADAEYEYSVPEAPETQIAVSAAG